MAILTYRYFLIKNLGTSGRPLMVLSGFLQSSSLGSALTVFLSQVLATDHCWPAVPGWCCPAHAAYRAEPCLTLSLLQQGLDCPWLCITLSSPERPVARTAKQQSKACQRGSSTSHWAFTRGKNLQQRWWYLVQYVLICSSAVTSTYCCSCREADTDANEMPSAICNSLSSAEQ